MHLTPRVNIILFFLEMRNLRFMEIDSLVVVLGGVLGFEPMSV